MVNRQHIVTAIAMHTDPSIKQSENKAPVIQALVVIQIITLSQNGTGHCPHVLYEGEIWKQAGENSRFITTWSQHHPNCTVIFKVLSLFSNPWLYRLEGSHCGLYLSVSDRSGDINSHQ